MAEVLTPEAKRVLDDLRLHGDSTASQIGARIGMPSRHVRARLIRLGVAGLAEHVYDDETDNCRTAHVWRAIPQPEFESAGKADYWALHRAITGMAAIGREETC